MRKVHLVPALLGVDHLVVVEDFESESSLNLSWQFFTILEETKVEARHNIVCL